MIVVVAIACVAVVSLVGIIFVTRHRRRIKDPQPPSGIHNFVFEIYFALQIYLHYMCIIDNIWKNNKQ
jgi:heme/copper-type cytochrome/quinol oxidase subunit 2